MHLDVVALAAVCWVVAALASLRIAPPQLLLLIRTATHRDDLWLYRLKTTLLFGSLAVSLLRNAAVWVDAVWFDTRYLGSIEDRRAGDLAISAVVMLACLLAAYLYHRDQPRDPGGRP